MFVDESPVLITLPSSVDLKVVEAADAVRGNTSTNATKQVKMETGLLVDVPLFIRAGEVLKISTEDKKYLGRA
jgi:elongation factor P